MGERRGETDIPRMPRNPQRDAVRRQRRPSRWPCRKARRSVPNDPPCTPPPLAPVYAASVVTDTSPMACYDITSDNLKSETGGNFPNHTGNGALSSQHQFSKTIHPRTPMVSKTIQNHPYLYNPYTYIMPILILSNITILLLVTVTDILYKVNKNHCI